MKPNAREADVILLKEKNVPRNEWKMGVVTSCVLAEDGLVRRVTLDIISSDGRRRSTERAIQDLVLLHRPASSPLEGQCVGIEEPTGE